MDWATLFDRSPEGVTIDQVRETLARQRESDE
jgi:hypothetical protein